MELKQYHYNYTFFILLLLIVPYGIETNNPCRWILPPSSFNRTLWNWNLSLFLFSTFDTFTFNRTLWNWNLFFLFGLYRGFSTFNRTLWNWNLLQFTPYARLTNLLIVPYGIETQYWHKCRLQHLCLLIVPYGIETLYNPVVIRCILIF